MPEVIVLHGFLVLTMFYVTAGSFSTNDQQLIAAYLLPIIYPSSRRLACTEATHICPGKQMNVGFGKQVKIQCLSHKDCASQKICCWSNCWSKYSCQDPVFIVKLEDHSEHIQEDFQTNVKGKYKIALPCETCNETLTAQTWTYSANDAPILQVKDEHSKVKRAATTNTPKAKKKQKPKPNVTKAHKELAKNINQVPKVTKKSPPSKSKYQKKKKTATKTRKKKLSKNNKKSLKAIAKKPGTPTKQIKINTKTTKTMKNSDETKRNKIINTEPTKKMALTTVKRTKPTNKMSFTTVKRTKPTKKMAMTTVKRTKPANKMALTIVRTNPTKKIALTTVKRTKTTNETIPSVTKEEISSVKATQNNSTKNFYKLFKIKTKHKIPENGEVLGSTRKFHLLQVFNENTIMDKYQREFPIKSRKNAVKSAGRLVKLEQEQNSTTEIVKITKLTKKTALTTVTKPTNKITMKIIKRIKPTNKMTQTTIKKEKPTNKTALITETTTKPTMKMALTTVTKEKLSVINRAKPANKMTLAVVRTNPTKKIALTTIKRTKTIKETIPSVTREEISSVKATQNISTKNFYKLFKIKTKQKIPEKGEVQGATRKFHLLQDFNEITIMDKYQRVFPIKSRKYEVKSAGKLFKLEQERNSTTEIVKRTKLTKKTALTTVTKPTNKMTMKTIKKTKPTNKMTQTTVKREKPTNETALTTAKKTRSTKKMALTTVKKEKPTNKMALTIIKRTKPTNKVALTILRTNPTKQIALTTVKRRKTTQETIPSFTKEEISSVKATQNNSTKNFYELFKIKTKQKISENGEVLGSTRKFHLLQDFNENTFIDKYQRVIPIKSRKNEVKSEGRAFKLEQEQNSTIEIVKRTKLTKKTALTTVTKPTNKMTMKTIKRTKPTNKITQTTIKKEKPTNKMALTTETKTRPTKKMALTTVKKEKLTIMNRTKLANKMAVTIVRTNPTKKIALATVKGTKTAKEKIPSVTKEEFSSVKATQNNSSKNFYGLFKIKRKQKIPENGEALGSTKKFHLLQDFSENIFMDKYQRLVPIKSRKDEVKSAGKLFKLEQEQNSTTEIVKRTKLTKKAALTTVTKPTNKMTMKNIKGTKPTNTMTQTILRTNPTKKIALTTVKRRKTTKETIPSFRNEEISSVKATQNNSTMTFNELFKIKTKQKIPENGEVLGSTRKFHLLQDFNENTFMDKYQGVFPVKARKNEVNSAGRVFKLEEEQNSTTEIVRRTKLTKKTALTSVTQPTNKMRMKIIKGTKPTNKMTQTTIKRAKPTNKTPLTTAKKTRPTNKTAQTTVIRTKPTKKMSVTTIKRTKPTVKTILSVTKEKNPAVEKATQNNSSKNFYGQIKIKKKQHLPENGELLGTTARKFPLSQEFGGNTFVNKYQGVYPVQSRKNEAISTGKLFNLEEQQSLKRETVKITKPTKILATKPTKKTSLTALKRTKPTKKMALATVKRTKPTKETIPTVAKEEIPVVEKVTPNNSTKNFYGLFKIKAKQELPENSEEVITTIRKFTPLQEITGNTPMSKYRGDFPLKPRKNEANSAGQLFNLETLPTLACAGLFLCVVINQ